MDSRPPVGIVVPMDVEFAPYRELAGGVRRLDGAGPWEVYEGRAGGRRLVLIISDCGPANAAAAVERLIAQHAPAAVLHGGAAGAHNPDLLPGDVVVGARYVIHTSRAERAARAARGFHGKLIRFRRDGARVHLAHVDAEPALLRRAEQAARREAARFGPWEAPGWPAGTPRRPARVMTGVIASADAWTVEPEELRALREDFGAECEDMESAYVAQVCALHRLPFLAVRAISNNDAVCGLAPGDVLPALAGGGDRAARVLTALEDEI